MRRARGPRRGIWRTGAAAGHHPQVAPVQRVGHHAEDDQRDAPPPARRSRRLAASRRPAAASVTDRPTAPPAARPRRSASVARPTPATRGRPRIRRIASTIGTATTSSADGDAERDRRDGQPRRRRQHQRQADERPEQRARHQAGRRRPEPAQGEHHPRHVGDQRLPGHGRRVQQERPGTAARPGSGCWTRTCAAGIETAAITAVPSQDISMSARVDPAQVRSKSASSVADEHRERAGHDRDAAAPSHRVEDQQVA